MPRNFLIAIITLTIVILVRGECDYEALTKPCFREMPRRNTSDTSRKLTELLRAFDMPLSQLCLLMTRLAKCVDENSESCAAGEGGHLRERHERMRSGIKLVCIDHYTEFSANIECMKRDGFRNELNDCQQPLDDESTCRSVKATMDCTDPVLDHYCPELSDDLSHLFLDYLTGRFQLGDCETSHSPHRKGHEDGDKSGAATLMAGGLSILLSAIYFLFN